MGDPESPTGERATATWEAEGKAYAEIHRGAWPPVRVVDVKRVEDGAAALLLRDQRGWGILVVVRGGKVPWSGTEQEFRDRNEAQT